MLLLVLDATSLCIDQDILPIVALEIRYNKNNLIKTYFTAVGDKMRLPDDVTMGYIVEQLAGVAMTRLDQFHSHLEPLRLVTNLPDQISFSYSAPAEGGPPEANNLIEIAEGERWDLNVDPTRFLSIHCHLFPATDWCQEEDDS